MVNCTLHLVLVLSAPPGVVQTVLALLTFVRSLLVNCSVTKLPEPPLSSKARRVTALALPCRVLSLTNTMGLRSSVLTLFLAGRFQP